ncbi:MAG: molybdopterin-dependent oxidoreductase [Melioribacteraceae bacterium]|nr:molybdopterin-dependent oxidoreductase [Melioribacteraceae bacterium]MCF8355674.1 molybdopterin-dependent oxidoreductase [Melioribacteraceae bacterium]MCF8396343.1 molybdopterin-dependent oxidoreductase [Melioribacteraceae bacterium]MCF8420324.1 molybdopterin-dependent oxidoreductase [Melioribacteraceae bacterium]
MTRKIIKAKYIFEGDPVEKIAEVPGERQTGWVEGTDLKIVGKEHTRKDGYDKVSGSAIYTIDKELPNILYARTLRSPFPNALIKSIDTSKAEKLKGVVKIIHKDNIPKITWYWDSTLLFDPHVRHEGDEVVCVAAETTEIAEEALSLINIEYEELPFTVSASEAMKDDAPKVHDWGNVMGGKPSEHSRGDIEKGFAEADEIVEDEFSTQIEIHHPTEVHCSVANWDGDYLTIWDSTQAIFNVRREMSRALNMPESRIRILKKYMGGGFGSKLEGGKYSVMAALLAKETGRPVKIFLDRKEMNLAVGNRPDSFQRIKIGAKKDGN